MIRFKRFNEKKFLRFPSFPFLVFIAIKIFYASMPIEHTFILIEFYIFNQVCL